MTQASASTAPRLVTRTRLLVGLGVLLVIAGLVTLFWKPIKWNVWISGANDPEYQRYLLEENDPALIPQVVDGMRDSKKGNKVRVSLANVLIRKNRIAEVEALLKDPALDQRIVAFQAFADKPYFRKQYVDEPTWGVEKTVLDWLGDADRPNRAIAIDKLDKVHAPPNAPPAVLEKLRALLGQDRDPDLRWRAALKLVAYNDCASVPALVAAAKAEDDAEPQFKLMSAVLQIFDNEISPCRKDVAEADVRAIVDRAYAHVGDRNNDIALRQRAIMHYRRWPAHAGEQVESLRRRLSKPGNAVERRAALEALVAAKDVETIRLLPKYFHDDSGDVRSSAVQSLPGDPAADLTPYEGALIGYVRDEPGPPAGRNYPAFEQAFHRLRTAAGEWVGFPEKYRKDGASLETAKRERIAALWKTGKFEDVTREQVVEAWWRWLAKRNGVADEATIDEVQKTRAAFWERAKAKDAKGARALLEKSLAERPNLWSYENGWLLKYGG